jgi:hypothetical protein
MIDLNSITLTLEQIAPGKRAILLRVGEQKKYNDDGTATDEIIGTTYLCVSESRNYEKFNVKVLKEHQNEPVITDEQLKDAGKVYITFDNFSAKLYQLRDSGGSITDRKGGFNSRAKFDVTCTATKASIIQPTKRATE